MPEGRLLREVFILFLMYFIFLEKTESLFASYDNTYVLAVKQK
jgi:hypothetical protein